MMKEQRFPPGWIEQLSPLLGQELPDFLRSFADEPARGVRMRPGLAPLPEVVERVPWAEHAWYLPLSSMAGGAPAHEAGAYYLQEPSAMAAAAALHPSPGERVLDLCAAPGGKSTQLAAYMQGRGVLVCNEPVFSRAQILSRNLERMGVINAVAVCDMPEELSPRWAGYFDKILVDAPCSGEGMFRRHPETREEWTAASPLGCAQRQEHILRHAAIMLRPGGVMAYSTCTFNSVENEGVIGRFLREHSDFSLLPFALPGLPESGGMLRLWPHKVRGEGHFVALLQRRPAAGEDGLRRKHPRKPDGLPAPGKDECALAQAFLREHISDPVTPNALFAGRIIAAPEEYPPLDGIRALRVGLHLGEIRGRVFIPDHALALACRGLKTVPVTESEAAAYQAGQALPGAETEKGFRLLTLDGLNLGWVKCSDGLRKNHYPKGLRR